MKQRGEFVTATEIGAGGYLLLERVTPPRCCRVAGTFPRERFCALTRLDPSALRSTELSVLISRFFLISWGFSGKDS